MSECEQSMDPETTVRAQNTRLRWLIPAFVAAATFIVFLPALKNGFLQWDDIPNLVDNRKYRGLGLEQLKWMFTSYGYGVYAPLVNVSYGFDYLVWGVNSFGYHLSSVLLHCFNTVLFYFLSVRLLALAMRPALRGKEFLISAGFAALFFSLHPLRVESAVWLSARHDMLSCFFYMLAVFLYIGSRQAGGENASFWRRHLLPLAAFLLALLSKGMAISLPVVLLILDVYPLRRLPGDPRNWFLKEYRHVWIEKIPFFVLAAVFGVIGYMCQAKAGALVSYQKFGFTSRAAQVLFAVSLYMRKTLIPLDLSPLYKLPDGFGLLNWQSLLAGALIAAITAAVIALRRLWPAGLAVWVYYLAALSPVSGIVKINTQAAADRYTYLSCLGFAVLAGAGFHLCLQAADKRLRIICAVIACLILTMMARLTWRQEGVWRDTETLWTHALSLNSELDYAHNNLGVVLAARGKIAEAERHYREALRINPEFPLARNSLGTVFAAQGKTAEAAEQYRKALNIFPDYADAHYNLGRVLAAQGKFDEAAGHYIEVIRFNPGVDLAHYDLGVAFAAQGKTAEAEKEYREALKISRDLVQAHNGLGLVLAARGKTAEAEEHYHEALRIFPDYADARYSMGLLLASRGKFNEAAAHYREALRFNPGIAMLHYNLGVALAAQGKADDAVKHYREALRLKPDFAEAHINLSAILFSQGRKEEALFHCREALRISPNNVQARNNLAAMLKSPSPGSF